MATVYVNMLGVGEALGRTRALVTLTSGGGGENGSFCALVVPCCVGNGSADRLRLTQAVGCSRISLFGQRCQGPHCGLHLPSAGTDRPVLRPWRSKHGISLSVASEDPRGGWGNHLTRRCFRHHHCLLSPACCRRSLPRAAEIANGCRSVAR